MKKEEMIWIASAALAKNFSYETLMYSDYMYDNPDFVEQVWEYVVEAKEKGMEWFRKEYSEYKLFGE